MGKARVNTSPVAGRYEATDEKIIEVSHELGGLLISFRPVDGRLIVDCYRADPTVTVLAAGTVVEVTDTCGECGQKVPDASELEVVNVHHGLSCSLHPKNVV
jgi:hypothetical protein